MSEPRRVPPDEFVPARLRREMPGFEVQTVRGHGWASKRNGELLRAADAEFDAFVTVGRNLVHQQNLSGLRLAIVVLVACSNNIRVLRPLLPELLRVLAEIGPGQVAFVPERPA